MKKKLILVVISASVGLSVLSCTKESKDTKSVDKKDTVVSQPEFHQELYGLYTGPFETHFENEDDYETPYENKKMTIKISRITKDSVYGQSIVGGNQRYFRGVFDEKNKTFVLDEPGDDKTDGRFEINLRKDSLVGKWSAYSPKSVKVPIKSLSLVKKAFVYNANLMLDKDKVDIVDWTTSKAGTHSYEDEDGKIETFETQMQRYATDAIFTVNASKSKLTENQLKNLKKLDLEIIKNAVFARHGYSFKKETYRQFFDQADWYVPISNNVDKDLSPLEKDNVALLNRFIKYAEDNYDTFGR